ncbi:hypothetical protein PLICRDRAFT_113461 [Plicaturopsis crispa FD-325 SS-3]|nr:hypothetical protein PLICRDRAFT_113461 [Plicaturopsis crispa FD-325 SS-3]
MSYKAADDALASGSYSLREIVYPTGMRGQIVDDTQIIERLIPGDALPLNPSWPTEPRFEIVAINGRGEGMRAAKDIAPGEVVVVEYPIVAVTVMRPTSAEDRKEMFDMAFDRVQDEHRAELLGLANCKRPEVCGLEEGIVRTNGIGIQLDAPPGTPDIRRTASGVFLKTSNCAPNAKYKWDVRTFTLTLHAVRPIQAGDEITVTYISTLASSRADRRQVLKERYGFHCGCSGCALPALEDVRSSDARRTALENWKAKRPPLQARLLDSTKWEHVLVDYKLAVVMLEQEGLQVDGRYPELLANIALIYARSGDRDRFKIWMQRAIEQMRVHQEEVSQMQAITAFMRV